MLFEADLGMHVQVMPPGDHRLLECLDLVENQVGHSVLPTPIGGYINPDDLTALLVLFGPAGFQRRRSRTSVIP